MNIVTGNFLQGLQDPNGIVVAPTNGVLTAKGLVMGAGAAKALADQCPSLPTLFLREIHARTTRKSTYWQYGFVPVTTPQYRYGAFQTKLDFRTPALPPPPGAIQRRDPGPVPAGKPLPRPPGLPRRRTGADTAVSSPENTRELLTETPAPPHPLPATQRSPP
jgi:hypothetical protein